jgi:hypothetical protein
MRDDLPGNGNLHRSAGNDDITLNVTQGKTKEVITALAELISGQGAKGDGFTVVADDMTTNAANETVAARYFHPDITSVAGIAVFKTEQGVGMHEYYEIVTPIAGTTDSTNDVVASLSIKLPAQCIILESAMTAVALAGSNYGLVALEIHNAAIADDAASGGTEILGENVSGDKSIPDANLDFSSDGSLYDTIHSGTISPIDRQTAVTYFHVTAKQDMASMTGSPKIGVYVKWFGAPAIALN